jgi:hypothetical protein
MENNNYKSEQYGSETPKEKYTGEDFGGFEDKEIDDIEENIKVEDILTRRSEAPKVSSPVVIEKKTLNDIIPRNNRTNSDNTSNELLDLINKQEDSRLLELNYSNINSRKGNANKVLSKMQIAENKYIDLKIDLDKFLRNSNNTTENLAKQNEDLLSYLDGLNDVVSICVNASKVPVKNPTFNTTYKKKQQNSNELINMNSYNNNKLVNVYRTEYHKLEQRFKQISDKTYEDGLENKLSILNSDITFYEQENKKLTNLQKQSEVFIERNQKFNPNSTEMKKMHSDCESLRVLNEGLIDKIQKNKNQITENELKIVQANERLEKLEKVAKEMGIDVMIDNVKEEAENDKKMSDKKQVLKKKMDILDRVLRTNKKKYESEIVKNERFIVQLEKDKIQMMKFLKEKSLLAYEKQEGVREYYKQYENNEVYFNNKKQYNYDSEMPYVINKATTEKKLEGNSRVNKSPVREVKSQENYIVNNKPNFKISFQPGKLREEINIQEDVKVNENIAEYKKEEIIKDQPKDMPVSVEQNNKEVQKEYSVHSSKKETIKSRASYDEGFKEVEDSPPQKLFSKNKGKSNSLISNKDSIQAGTRLSDADIRESIESVRETGKVSSQKKENVRVVENHKSFDIIAKKATITTDNEKQTIPNENKQEEQKQNNQIFIHKTLEQELEAKQNTKNENDQKLKAENVVKEEPATDNIESKSKGKTVIKNLESLESLNLAELKDNNYTKHDSNIYGQNNNPITEQPYKENIKTIETEPNKAAIPLYLRDYTEKDVNMNSNKEEFERKISLNKQEEQPGKRVRGAHVHNNMFEQQALLSDNIPKVNDDIRKRKEEFDNLFKDDNYKTQQNIGRRENRKRDLFEDLDEVII